MQKVCFGFWVPLRSQNIQESHMQLIICINVVRASSNGLIPMFQCTAFGVHFVLIFVLCIVTSQAIGDANSVISNEQWHAFCSICRIVDCFSLQLMIRKGMQVHI